MLDRLLGKSDLREKVLGANLGPPLLYIMCITVWWKGLEVDVPIREITNHCFSKSVDGTSLKKGYPMRYSLLLIMSYLPVILK